MNIYQTLACTLALLCLASAADNNLATKCSAEFQKVTACLPFATAKAPNPTNDCCDSVTALKNSDPACLCFIIQQIHNGTNMNMGVQEDRLLQLPTACKLANASVSECPKLLHLAPNSPDAAIFNNVTAVTSGNTPPVGGSSGGGSSPVKAGGIRHEPRIGVTVVLAVIAGVFLGFSAAALSA